jgi:spore coat polysaccharide biosynthesis protein SpsF (cytidylyltransferase family)
MKKSIAILILTLSCLASCDNYKELKNEEFKTAFILNSSATFKGYYYKGSDNEYHYFESKWDLRKDKDFKIPVEKFVIENNYKFKFGDGELRIDLFKENNELFGQNEYYKLYILKTNK